MKNDTNYRNLARSWTCGIDGHKGWAKRAMSKLRRRDGKVDIIKYLKGKGDDNG